MLRGCAVAVSAALASFAGHAQQTLAPVVVTATGFEQELKAAPASITVITREEGSGTRGAFEELALKGAKIATAALVQDSTGAVREMVHGDPSAIGYISLGQVNDQITRALAHNSL